MAIEGDLSVGIPDVPVAANVAVTVGGAGGAGGRAGTVEVDTAGHELAASTEGRVLSVRATVGERVSAGEVIIELDDRDTRLALSQSRERVRSLELVVQQRGRLIAVERKALEAAGDQQGLDQLDDPLVRM